MSDTPPKPGSAEAPDPEVNGEDVSRRAGSRGACPDADTLAAFVDRQLDETGRRRVVMHIARCLDCYEVVADSLHFVGLGGAAGRRTLEEEEAEGDGPQADTAPSQPTSGRWLAERVVAPHGWRVPALVMAALLVLTTNLWWRAPTTSPTPPRLAQASPPPSSPASVRPSPAVAPSPGSPRPSNDAPLLDAALEARLDDWKVRDRVAFETRDAARPCAMAVGALAALAGDAHARGASAQIEAIVTWVDWGLAECKPESRALAIAQVRAVDRGQALVQGPNDGRPWVRAGYDLESWLAGGRACTGAMPNSTAGLRAARSLLEGHVAQAKLDTLVSLTEEATPWNIERCRRLTRAALDLRGALRD